MSELPERLEIVSMSPTVTDDGAVAILMCAVRGHSQLLPLSMDRSILERLCIAAAAELKAKQRVVDLRS